ncbi:hypothetical protein TCAL_04787 [Tigriopus californicus]|uniref:Uncharacterized protein n=1 Tax=Tigriopus californicus TaxID=6832 RepID=A0A553PDD2_TIGCA|nr:hypothetical protein TCAL_04787 [Tigriopus californicus]
MSSKTTTDWGRFWRDIAGEFLLANPIEIGG